MSYSSKHSPELLLVTSTSKRRIQAAEISFPQAQILPLPGTEEEEETPYLEEIARQKVTDALLRLKKEHDVHNPNCVWATTLRYLSSQASEEKPQALALAADANNVAGGLEFFPKPTTLEQARYMLAKTGAFGFYDIQAATAIKNGVMVSGTAESRIVLNSAGKRALISKGGQDTYMSYVAEHFGETMIYKVSGAIMLEVLLALGWVESIQGAAVRSDSRVTRSASRITEYTTQAFNYALTSVVPGVLGLVSPTAQDNLEQYTHIEPYLDWVSDHRLASPQ